MSSPLNVYRQSDDKNESYSNKKSTLRCFFSRVKLIRSWTYWKIRFVLGWPYWKIKFIFGWIYWNIIIARVPSLPSNNQLRKKTLSRHVLGWACWKIIFILGWLYWKPKFFFGWIYWNIIRDFKFHVNRLYSDSLCFITGRRKIYSLISIYNYCKLPNVSSEIVFPSQKRVHYKLDAIFFGEKKQRCVPDIYVDIPPICLYEVKNTLLMSKSDFTFTSGMAICHDNFDVTRHFTYEEMHESKVVNVDPKNQTIIVKLLKKPEKTIEIGVLLVSATSANWAHWLSEILPKLLIIDNYPAYKNYPLIVDERIPLSALESLEKFNKNKRNIIRIKEHEPYLLKRGICISPTTIVPFDPRRTTFFSVLIQDTELAFCAPALCALRDAAFERFNISPQAKPTRKIYIKRTGTAKKMLNDEKIEEILRNKGYDIILPHLLSFEDQVKIFQQAKIIIGQGGAGLMNMIFVPPGCKIMVLSTFSTLGNYYYFSMAADVLSHKLHYIFGEIEPDASKHPAFQDFIIDEEKFASHLDQFELENFNIPSRSDGD